MLLTCYRTWGENEGLDCVMRCEEPALKIFCAFIYFLSFFFGHFHKLNKRRMLAKRLPSSTLKLLFFAQWFMLPHFHLCLLELLRKKIWEWLLWVADKEKRFQGENKIFCGWNFWRWRRRLKLHYRLQVYNKYWRNIFFQYFKL